MFSIDVLSILTFLLKCDTIIQIGELCGYCFRSECNLLHDMVTVCNVILFIKIMSGEIFLSKCRPLIAVLVDEADKNFICGALNVIQRELF